mgnify:CR=1 FL=1
MLKMKFLICIDKLQFVIYNTLNGEKMKIVGKIEQIIYKNELNSWTVLLIKVDKKYLPAVGPTADIELEDTIEFEKLTTDEESADSILNNMKDAPLEDIDNDIFNLIDSMYDEEDK